MQACGRAADQLVFWVRAPLWVASLARPVWCTLPRQAWPYPGPCTTA